MSIEQPSQSTDIQRKDESGDKVFDFLERTGFVEMRKSDDKFEEWIQKLTYQEYKDHLNRLNGKIRGIPSEQRSTDGENVEIGSGMLGLAYLPPYPDQKDPLMQKAFEALKNIPNNNDRALLSYYALQAIHPYADGNGRTGRLLYNILSDHGKTTSKDDLAKLLDHDKEGGGGTGEGRETFAKEILEPEKAYMFVNRELVKDIAGEDFLEDYGKIFSPVSLGSGYVPETLQVNNSDHKLAEKILGEGDTSNFSFRGIVLLKFLKEKGKLDDYTSDAGRRTGGPSPRSMYGEAVPEDIGKKIFTIDQEKLVEDISKEDVLRMMEIHRDIKQQFIEKIIDIFENSEKYMSQDNKGNVKPIKDIFRIG